MRTIWSKTTRQSLLPIGSGGTKGRTKSGLYPLSQLSRSSNRHKGRATYLFTQIAPFKKVVSVSLTWFTHRSACFFLFPHGLIYPPPPHVSIWLLLVYPSYLFRLRSEFVLSSGEPVLSVAFFGLKLAQLFIIRYNTII